MGHTRRAELMTARRATAQAGAMMLIWLAVWLTAAVALPRWADFLAVVGCILPRALFSGVKTYGASDCNTIKYKKREYCAYFVFCICGCLLLSALSAVLFGTLGAAETEETAQMSLTVGRTDFWYRLVFACLLPAVFEEYLVRGGVLGALAPLGKRSVLLCGICFCFMHISPGKWLFALFAGVLLSALVYLAECVYLGMLLHFANNLVALGLLYISEEFMPLVITAAAILLVTSFILLRRTRLFCDVLALLAPERASIRGGVSILFWLFLAAAVFLGAVTVI